MTAYFTLLLATVLSLDGAWDLSYFRQPEAAPVRSLPVPSDVEVRQVQATVPGNCELDLVRAGLAPNPEIGTNSYAFRKWEGYEGAKRVWHLWYGLTGSAVL